MLRLDLREGHEQVSLRAASITPCPLIFLNQSTQHAAVRIYNQDVVELPYVPRTHSYQGENLPKCLRGSRVSVKLLDIEHGRCAARLFFFFFPVQQTTSSGIGHRVK